MTTREGEANTHEDIGSFNKAHEEDEIDRLNKKSYWYIYVMVGVVYLSFGIWYGFAIYHAR